VHNTPVNQVRHLPAVVGSDRQAARLRLWLAASAGRAFLVGVAICSALFAATIAAQAPGTVWDGVYTAEQADRGNATYQRFCASCHGDQLLGAEAAPPLVGDAFNANWDGVTLGDLVNRIRTTMPQNQPGAMSRAQTADVLAFILQSGKFPAGSTAFDSQAMSAVMFRSNRP
jgi:S-disulfanyl-L-cysteine oxidoreductase SoxD